MGSLRQTSAVSDRGYNRAEIDRTRSRKRLKKSRPSRLGSKLLPLQKICGRHGRREKPTVSTLRVLYTPASASNLFPGVSSPQSGMIVSFVVESITQGGGGRWNRQGR